MIQDKVTIDVLKEVFSISLTKAADSLSFFVGKKIFIKNLHLNLIEHIDSNDVKEGFKNAEVILETKIKGELSALTYLMFSSDDIKSFFKVAHPNNPNATINDEYSKELLLEADNILVASVVSALANILKGFFYGDVPALYMGNDQESLDKITCETCGKNTLKIEAHFVSEGESVKPWFVWMIDDTFLERLMEYASSQDELFKLKELANI